MVTLEGINDISDIIDLRGTDVYINEEDLNDIFLEEDLVNGYSISVNDKKYKIKSISKNSFQTIMTLENNRMIPFVKDFIENIDTNEKIVYMNIPNGLL